MKIAAQGARAAGAEVTYLIWAAGLLLPFYDKDLEEIEDWPANLLKLKALMKADRGFLIACLE